jgi:ATP-binding protein involved in chromosome partitioning
MNFTEKHISDALSTVQEPDLKKDLVTLQMIRNIQIEGNNVRFTVVLTTPACPLKEKIRKDCESAIHQTMPNAIITIDMIAEVTTAAGNRPKVSNIKNIIAVASGKGGVGKSTVTANLALALASQGARVGIVDADIYGPSIPIMFGVADAQPDITVIDERQYILPIEKMGIKIISMGFLSPSENAVVWRGPMASKALTQFLADTYWGELDYLFIDMPPGTGDIHLALVQAVPVTGVVIVTTPQKVAIADAIKGLGMFRQPQINVPILGIVENMSYFTPAELPDNRYYIFGQDGGKVFAERYDAPFLGEIPLVQGIRESGDMGVPSVANQNDPITASAFIAISEALAQQIAIRNAEVEPTNIVEIKV